LLIIISDLHLVDGTCGVPISSAAFNLFADRIKELAINASWRRDQTYRPVDSIDILLLGDILDPLHSTQWFNESPGQPGYVRPWSEPQSLAFATKLRQITRAILQYNEASIKILRGLSEGRLIRLNPADRQGRIAQNTRERILIPIRIHYMVGNHDWYYHLPGTLYDNIRKEIVSQMGLFNAVTPFPHDASESITLQKLFETYRVCARHGDIYDSLNYDPVLGRNGSSLGDAFSIEMVSRIPWEINRRLGKEFSPDFIQNLRNIVNVRPTLITPLWVNGLLKQNNVPQIEQDKFKQIWNELVKEFLDLEFVHSLDRHFEFDTVDALNLILKFSSTVSIRTIDDIVKWIHERFISGQPTFSHNALKESAFLNRTAQYIVYGHTHHPEVIPLDSNPIIKQKPFNQMCLNTGTWHTYYDLAVHNPGEEKFIPYQVLSYLSFYKDDQRGGRRFEAWSGSLSE
jgi:hypothetical protein